MTNEEAKVALIGLYADLYKVSGNDTSAYAEAVATAISALERAGDGNG
jgi:hypothetical protein